MLSNFEKGFQMYIDLLNSNNVKVNHVPTIRKMNEAICLMASEDYSLMESIVVNEWQINKALNSAYGRKYNLV